MIYTLHAFDFDVFGLEKSRDVKLRLGLLNLLDDLLSDLGGVKSFLELAPPVLLKVLGQNLMWQVSLFFHSLHVCFRQLVPSSHNPTIHSCRSDVSSGVSGLSLRAACAACWSSVRCASLL